MKYLHRFLSFVAKRLVILSAVSALLILAFYLAMNTANIYLLMQDGLSLRVQVILKRENAEEMTNYFTNDFLNNDEPLAIGLSAYSPYVDYTITDYSYNLSLEWVWAWPWENSATATIVERVPKITGKVNSDRSDAVASGLLTPNPPPWNSGRYTVRLVRVDGRWKIDKMTYIQMIREETEAGA